MLTGRGFSEPATVYVMLFIVVIVVVVVVICVGRVETGVVFAIVISYN